MKKYLVLIALVAFVLLMVGPVSAAFSINGVTSCASPGTACPVTLQYNATWVLSNPNNETIAGVQSWNGGINSKWASHNWLDNEICGSAGSPGSAICRSTAQTDTGASKSQTNLPDRIQSLGGSGTFIAINWIGTNSSESVHFNPNGLPYPPTVNTNSYETPSAAYMVNNFSSLQGVDPGSVALATVAGYVNTHFRTTNLVCNVSGSLTTLETSSTFSGYSSQFPLTFPNRPAVCYMQETTYNNNQCDQNSCTQMYAVGGSGELGNPPVANFATNFQTCDPIAAQFNDTSVFSPLSQSKTWSWDFGDGYYSNVQNVTHIFPATGSYTVNLTVSDFYGTDTASAPVSMSACTGNLSTFFYYPVSVIDAVTGYPIAESWLNVAQLDTGEWYNISSHTGNFTISGKGTLGTTKLEIYDVLTLTGNATGYFDDGFNLIVDESNNGIEQFLSLVPGTDAPKPGDFIVVFTVEDAETSSSLPGVSIQVNGTTKQTNAGGSVMFKNLTGGTTYQYTASKYAYTTITGSFTNTSSMVKYVDVIMNRETAPTPTVTVPTATPTNIPSTYPTIPGQTPTVTPTGVPGSYSGAFGGIENALAEWGVSPTEMGIVLAAILILLGFLLGGFVSAPAFNPMTGFAGATLGLLFAIAFGFLGIIYIIALILSAAFIAIFFLSR